MSDKNETNEIDRENILWAILFLIEKNVILNSLKAYIKSFNQSKTYINQVYRYRL